MIYYTFMKKVTTCCANIAKVKLMKHIFKDGCVQKYKHMKISFQYKKQFTLSQFQKSTVTFAHTLWRVSFKLASRAFLN